MKLSIDLSGADKLAVLKATLADIARIASNPMKRQKEVLELAKAALRVTRETNDDQD